MTLREPGSRTPAAEVLPGRVIIAIGCLVIVGSLMVLGGLKVLSGLLHPDKSYPEAEGDAFGIAVVIVAVLLPPGIACLLACVPFFLSERLRWLWFIPIGVSLVPLGFFVWVAAASDNASLLAALIIPLVPAALPLVVSLFGYRGRWRRA